MEGNGGGDSPPRKRIKIEPAEDVAADGAAPPGPVSVKLECVEDAPLADVLEQDPLDLAADGIKAESVDLNDPSQADDWLGDEYPSGSSGSDSGSSNRNSKTIAPAKRLQYTQEDMMKAIDAARGGMSIRKASITFKVPKTTLTDKLKGRVPFERKIGPTSILTAEEESHLVDWILHSAKVGSFVTTTQLTDSVQLLIRQSGRENPFPEDRPRRHWHQAFKRRHPEVAQKVSHQNVSGQRTKGVTEEKIRKWFSDVRKYLKSTNHESIFEDPKRIFNCDETAMSLCPEGMRDVKGQKTSNDNKECLTTLVMCNASGEMAPSMIMFKYKKIPKSVAAKVPKHWAVGKSEHGWMTAESFYEYIANIFLPWVNANGIETPVILFVDGHTSRLTMQLSKFCSQNGIVLISLHPNSTHLLQPLDVAVFHPLKVEWRRAVVQWQLQHNDAKLLKEDFAPLLSEVFENMTKLPGLIQNGFVTCGLCPFTAENVKFENVLKKSSDGIEDGIQKSDDSKDANVEGMLRFFEKYNEDRMDSFRSSGAVWNGRVEDTSLFHFWQLLRKQAKESNGEYLEENAGLAASLSNSEDAEHEERVALENEDDDSDDSGGIRKQ